MNRFRVAQIWSDSALGLAVSLALVATAAGQLAPPAPAAPARTEFAVVPVTNATVADVAKMVNTLLVPKTGAPFHFAADEKRNALVFKGSAEDLARVKELLKLIDVPEKPNLARLKLHVYTPKHLMPNSDSGVQAALRLLFADAPKGSSFALDPARNAIIVRGDEATCRAVAALLERLEAATPEGEVKEVTIAPKEPRATEFQVRIVWLITGLKETSGLKETPKPAKDLDQVVAELAKLGINDPRLVAQWIINATLNAAFETQGTVKLETPVKARLSGMIVGKPDSPSLEIGIEATYSSRNAVPVSQIRTTISAPLGHSVVLGATPSDSMTSVFVVQILPKATASKR